MSQETSTLFTRGLPSEGRRPRAAWLVSLAIHVLLVTALLRGRSPVFVAPSSMLGGANGTAITHLYWATGSDAEAKSSSQAMWRVEVRAPEGPGPRPSVSMLQMSRS